VAHPEDDRRCPRCAAPYNDGQEYCLECGERLPARPSLITRLGAGWRRRAGWYPGDWIWPALLALVVAIVAGVVSAVLLADGAAAAPTAETHPRRMVCDEERLDDRARLGADHERAGRRGRRGQAGAA